MRLCNVVGCPCEGTNSDRAIGFGTSRGPNHYEVKAYENGFRYYAASYGPRYGDPIGTYVSLRPNRAAIAADSAAAIERREIIDACEDDACDGSCAEGIICYGPDAVFRAKDLFSPAELREHRRALLRGEVVCLSR